MKQIIIAIVMLAFVSIVLSWNSIVIERFLKKPIEKTIEEISWVNDYRGGMNKNIRTGVYKFVYKEDDLYLSFRYHFNNEHRKIYVEGILFVKGVKKDIKASAGYSIDGSVLDFTDAEGHVSIFPVNGQVFAYSDDNNLIFKSKDNVIVSRKLSQ